MRHRCMNANIHAEVYLRSLQIRNYTPYPTRSCRTVPSTLPCPNLRRTYASYPTVSYHSTQY